MNKIELARSAAKEKAVDFLGRYKFQMFGYWAALWVSLNRLCEKREKSPFQDFVIMARAKKEADDE